MEKENKKRISNEEKLKVYEKFQERKEENIIKNKGETYNFGDGTVTIYELPWEDADIFEDKVVELVNEVASIFQTDIDDKKIVDSLRKINISELLDKFLKTLLRQGLIDLATIASNGEITMESVKSQRATKSQVINIVIGAVMLNYGYLKNLIPLAAFK